jgi:GT2 family glycosyltransferase
MRANQRRHPLALALPAADFPVTICVLAYGANVRIAERFLASLYSCTDPRLFYLRAGLNAVEPASRKLFRKYASQFGNVTLFESRHNIFKSPMMHRMFYDPPLATTWTIWCDDDTHFFRRDWLPRLGLNMELSPKISMWGRPYALWSSDATVVDWIKKASWYQGKRCIRARDPHGKMAVKFRFAPGAFWAARTEVLRRLNWPDRRLIHANEDFLLGEALRQNNLLLGRFDYGVKINDAPRRNSDAPEVRRLNTY